MRIFIKYELSNIKLIALAVIISATSGCPMQDKIYIVGRYKEAVCEDENARDGKIRSKLPCNQITPEADVSVVTIKTPEEAPASVIEANFPDKALSEYIKGMADPQKSATAEAFRQNLATPLKPPQESTQAEDWTVFDRNMIVTVEKKDRFNPADRLEATDVIVEPCSSSTKPCVLTTAQSEKWKFESWDRATTENTTINAGTLQVKQKHNAETKIVVEAPPNSPISAGLTQKFIQETARAENLNAVNEVDNLTVFVNSNNGALDIHRQGGIGIDLTGNTIIRTRLKLNDSLEKLAFYNDGDYFNKMGELVSPEKLTIKSQLIRVPIVKDIEKECGKNTEDAEGAVKAQVKLVYTMRHVNSGDDSLEEADDIVTEKTRSQEKEVELIPARDVRKYLYSLVRDNINCKLTPEKKKECKVFVDWHQELAPPPLCFKSLNEAQNMLAYLKRGGLKFARPGALGNTNIGFLENKSNSVVPLNNKNAREITVIRGCWPN